MTQTDITPVDPFMPAIPVTSRRRRTLSLAPQTYDQAWHFAEMIARSGLAPKEFQGKPENCFIAMQWGDVLGLDPMAAIRGIAVINGRPALWGDTMLALVRASPVCEYVKEEFQEDVAICRVKRKGKSETEHVCMFSLDDARAAGLLGKPGPWQQYQKRMLQMRARGFALRDVFPDVLQGIDSAEEVYDEQVDSFVDAVTTQVQPQLPQRQPPSLADPATVPVETQPKLYSQERFEKNFEKWASIIMEGKMPAERLIAFIESKGSQLTPEQRERLANIPVNSPAVTPSTTDGEDTEDEELFE
ncbi:MAG: hypothetical protein IKZ87_03105 [Actinomycetaceae bacterium]|nr:hypothetical protein [Actinomycetaceae bacterium]